MAALGQTFALDVSEWCKAVPAQAEDILRKVAMDMFTRVVMRSPVDTGRFRGHWVATIGTPSSALTGRIDPSGAKSVALAASVAMKVKIGQSIFLCNNLPYALPLEYGHSKQAPAGMVRVAVAEFQNLVTKAARSARQQGKRR